MYSLSKVRSYENLGLIILGLGIAIAGIYSYKLFSFLMPLITLSLFWSQRGIKNFHFNLSPPLFFLFLLLIYTGISISWAENLPSALKTFIALSVTSLFASLFISCVMRASPDLISKAYRIMQISGLILMVLVVFQALMDTFQVEISNKFKNIPYMMKPTGSILGLMAFVGCAFLWIKKERFFSIYIFLFFFPLIILTLCKTAFYGLLLASCIFILSYAMPFWVTRISMISTYTFLIVSPILYAYLVSPARVLDSPYFTWILNRSFFHRFLAWEFYSKKFFEQPLLGWGLDSSRFLWENSRIVEEYDNTLHPHNNSLQAYVELGLGGGILYALFFASLFWMVEKNVKDRLSVAVCNATLIFAFVEAEVTHNLWRNYWLSLLTLTAGLLILFLKAREAQLRA